MAKKKLKLNLRTIAILSASTLGIVGWSGPDYQPLISARESGSRVITRTKDKIEALRDSAQGWVEALRGHESSRR